MEYDGDFPTVGHIGLEAILWKTYQFHPQRL